jgi:hypothetical protein
MTAPDHAMKPLENILRERGHPYMDTWSCSSPRFFATNPTQTFRCWLRSLASAALLRFDPAQTAFGHRSIETADNVAVVSCPRKCTGLGDGAIIRMEEISEEDRASVESLPWAISAVAAKLAAR